MSTHVKMPHGWKSHALAHIYIFRLRELMNCNVSLCSLYLLQDLEPSQFSLIEVLLDRGVAERVLERDEKPWKLIQQTRKVGLLNYHWDST